MAVLRSLALPARPLPIFSPFHPNNRTPLPLHFLSFNSNSRLSFSSPSHSTEILHLNFDYGPSLLKGHPTHPDLTNSPSTRIDESETDQIDKNSFARVFDVSAIRVPAEDCSSLENRLRGHLLNWPRVRNVLRVPGDEMERDFRKLLWNGEIDVEESLKRRMGEEGDVDLEVDSVIYREKLAKSFNCRGFLKFRNLAAMSRPKIPKVKKTKDDGRKKEKDGVVKVEIVEVGGDDGGEMKGLIGEGFRSGGWKGATRLLLLDERYADKDVDQLPPAVKAVLKGEADKRRNAGVFEIVRCKLTLFYDYWPTHEVLEALLPDSMIVPTAFETVGHIAHLNLRNEHLPYKKLIAQVILDKNKPKIQTVVNKVNLIQNDYRTMELEVLAGNHSLVTTVIENGIHFNVDLAKVYWNSRLATERRRLIDSFSSTDVVCDVFSGVGPIAIAAAKKVKHVYANDLNPIAVDYLERNLVHNKLERRVEVFNMDGRRFVETVFGLNRADFITQVIMNLPKDAVEYLDAFRGLSRQIQKSADPKLPRIHLYGFSKAVDPEFDFHERIRTVLYEAAIDIEMHRVRLVAPGKWMLCASFDLPKSVVYDQLSEDRV